MNLGVLVISIWKSVVEDQIKKSNNVSTEVGRNDTNTNTKGGEYMPLDKRTLDEYFAKTELKYIEKKEKEKVKPTEILMEARNAVAKAELDVSISELAALQLDTSFEEVTCIGFHPRTRKLAAVVEVKLEFGYGGLVSNGIGSDEYVGLYVDWAANGFKDPRDITGGVTGVHVFDPGSGSRLPLNYAVYMPVFKPQYVKDGTVAQARSVLSWQVPPTGPDFKPVWGNVFDRWIRYHP